VQGDRAEERDLQGQEALSAASVLTEFRRVAARAGVRRPFVPHLLRHAHAHEGVPHNIIQRQLGHANLGTTSIYLQGIDPRGDHHGRAHAPRADDVGRRRATALSNEGSGSVAGRFRSVLAKRAPVWHGPRRMWLVHRDRAAAVAVARLLFPRERKPLRVGSIRQILDRVADRWSLLVVAVLDHRTMRLPEPSSLSAALGADHRQLQSSA
jgi:hypothetical protein